MLDECNLPPKKRMEAMNIDHQIDELAADEKRSSLSFCDLPVEILLEIFEKMDKSQHMAIRATSKYLRDFSDNFIMNEFQKALSKSCATNEYCLKNETILVIFSRIYLHKILMSFLIKHIRPGYIIYNGILKTDHMLRKSIRTGPNAGTLNVFL